MSIETSHLLEPRPESEILPFPLRHRFQAKTPRAVLLILCLSILFLATAGSLQIVPVTKLLEDVLCYRYYNGIRGEDSAGDRRSCKINEIQGELAYVQGFQSMLEAIVGLCVAFPYGIMADRIGRKSVFALSSLGFILNMGWVFAVLKFPQALPPRFTLLAPLFLFIGGGDTVIVAVVYSIVADVETQINRATAFFFVTFTSYTAVLMGPPISSRLMEISTPFTSLSLSMLLVAIGAIILLIFIPETLHARTIEENLNHFPPERHHILKTIHKHINHALNAPSKSLSILYTWSAIPILCTFLIQNPVNRALSQIFVQYISKRFDWAMESAGYLLTIRGAVNIVVILIALPLLSKLLTSQHHRFKFSSPKKDLLLAQTSALFLTIGAFLLAAPQIAMVIVGIVIITLGCGFPPLCRSLITTFVDAEHTTRLYTLVGILESIGSLFAGPAFAWLFAEGIKMGGFWMGLPYFWLSGICAVVTISIFFAKLEDTKDPEEGLFVENRIERGLI